MTITDDELKKLKEWAETVLRIPHEDDPDLEFSCTAQDFLALLERLRWAEKCTDLCATDENCCNIPELGENDTSPYYLWRKAAGKD